MNTYIIYANTIQGEIMSYESISRNKRIREAKLEKRFVEDSLIVNKPVENLSKREIKTRYY